METGPKRRRFFMAAGALSAFVLIAQIFRHPSAVRELLSGGFVNGIHLAYPLTYTLFAPFFQLADAFTILSLNQHIALFIFLNILRFVWRWFVFIRRRFRWRMFIGEFIRT